MSEENKALIRRWYEEWNMGNMDAVLALHDDNVIDHNPIPGQAAGIQGLKQSFEVFRNAFPDMRFTIDQLIAEGDKVVDHSTATGTHKGELQGIPPTGKQVTVTANNIWRIANGKIIEVWHVEDQLGMLQQLGVMPAPGAQPPADMSKEPRRPDAGRGEPGMSAPSM